MPNTIDYELHHTTPGALEQMRAHVTQYETDVMGLSFLVLPNVWSPKYDWSSLFAVENIPDLSGQDFLEIGPGTGVISVFAARANAKSVLAVDINPKAVKNTNINFKRHKTSNAQALISDGFSNVDGHYDTIYWNAPYHGSKPESMLERGCADEDYNDIRAFFAEVHKYLKRDGVVIFGFSESGDLPLIENMIDEAGFEIMNTLSEWRYDYNCMLFYMKLVK